jgi:hypothetical protein
LVVHSWWSYLSTVNNPARAFPVRGLPQRIVVAELLLQVTVYMLPLASTLVVQVKSLCSGHLQRTLVAEPISTGATVVAGVPCLAHLAHILSLDFSSMDVVKSSTPSTGCKWQWWH